MATMMAPRSSGTVVLRALRHERERRGLTVAQLALRSGLDRKTCALADSGEPVAVRTAVKLGEALKLVPINPVLDAMLGLSGAAAEGSG